MLTDIITTTNGSRVSRHAKIRNGSGGVSLGARCTVASGVELHGDRGSIILGADCILSTASVLRPGEIGDMIVIGARVLIGENSHVEARALGEGVLIGNNSVIGSKSIICESATILAHTHLPHGTHVPPVTVTMTPVRGGDAVVIATLPTACARGLPRGWTLH
jgi:carbonic anhydrase/acetyltransferase-like protein (isoleucine patch superfamily)